MNALDDIRIRAGSEVTESEALDVIQWCRDWAHECEWSDISDDEIDSWPIPSLLRNCDAHIDGGIRFVLSDVRQTAAMVKDSAEAL